MSAVEEWTATSPRRFRSSSLRSIPVAENQLVGLDGAVVNGRSLKSSDAPVTNGGRASITTTGHILQVPVLATTDPFVEDTDQITISRLPASAVTTVRGGLLPDQLAAALAKLPW